MGCYSPAEPKRGRRALPFVLLFGVLALASCRAGTGAAGFGGAHRAGPTAVLLPTATAAPVPLPAAAREGPPAAPTAPALPAPGQTSTPSVSSASPTAPAPSGPPDVARIMAVGARPSVSLRGSPSRAAPIAATLPGSDVFWAEGRSADGAWLLVTYGDAATAGWAAASDVTLFGDAARLPLLADDASRRPANSPATASPPGRAFAGEAQVDQLRVRAGPGAGWPVVAALAAGQAISVTGRSQDGGWLAVRWPPGAESGGTVAWVAARYVVIPAVGSVDDLPVVPAPSGSAAPAAPASAGRVAFQTRSGGDIYVVNPDGSGLRRVAAGLDPALAPGGARLAYARWEGPSPGIYLLDLAAGRESRVAEAAEARGPAWSPDGGRIVFARSQGARNCISTPFGCFDDAAVQSVFHGQDCLTMPFGRFCLSDYPRIQETLTRLTQVTLDGGQLDDLPSQSPVQSPAWRPNAAQIVYRGSKGLQLLEDGENLRLLVDDAAVSSPAWSPDGRRLAVQVRVHDHADIFLLDAAGGSRTALTRREPLSERAINNVSPAWSPDGTEILFLTDRDGAWRLYVMNADGSAQRPFLPSVLAGISFSYDYAAERVADWAR